MKNLETGDMDSGTESERIVTTGEYFRKGTGVGIAPIFFGTRNCENERFSRSGRTSSETNFREEKTFCDDERLEGIGQLEIKGGDF